MSKKLIFLPYVHIPGKRTGMNMEGSSNAFHEYCQNLCVALVSLRHHNPECDVALVTNADLSQTYMEILSKQGVIIFPVPYDRFVFPDDYPWSLAFYKLCALDAMVQRKDYDYYCYLDIDVVANRPLAEMWQECDHNIMLYDIEHGLQVPNYVTFLKEISDFDCQSACITHYGGEFFAASRKNAEVFLTECHKIYDEMTERNIITTKGDEFIVSLVAARNRHLVKNAGAYIRRFWTGSFRLISTCYEFDPVSVLHLPAEKRDGIIKLYRRYISKGKYPSNSQIYRICHLRRQSGVIRLKTFIKNLLSSRT